MVLVSKDDENRIAAAIAVAESKTSGEIVAMITASSASYRFAPVLWAALAALALPWPLIYFTWIQVQYIYLAQIIVFALLALLFSWRPLRYALVPSRIKRVRAHRRAIEQFLMQNLHTTDDRTGVLIFVSVAERYAEIVADASIHQKVPEGEWKTIVDALTQRIADGNAADGFVAAIEAVGQRLAQHFPPGALDPNTLPNHLIVLPSE
jgi:putative membrane protein